jgi:3-oxoacyl-(acyl-carrier-protein) synthase
MDKKIIITAASHVTSGDVSAARLGTRFGRLDLMSQLALLAVESLGINFEAMMRDRISICLSACAGSLSTDVEYWKGRDAVGGPSPTLFAYTLPSAAVGEIAIRHRLMGPNLCFVGGDSSVLAEAADLIRRGEAGGCVCVACDVITAAAAEMIHASPAAEACALFLTRGDGPQVLRENDRDMKSLCAMFSAQNFLS